MVVRTWEGNRLLWRALAASLGLHLLLALFLPVWTTQVSAGLQPIEAISFSHVVRVEIERPKAASLPSAVQRTTHRASVVSFAHTRPELTTNKRKPTVRPTAESGPKGDRAAAPRLLASQHSPMYARPAVSAQIASQQAAPAPSPQPATTVAPRAIAGEGENDRGGVLPLGAMQDPVLDPTVRVQLEKLAVHVTLIVTVGEDGHTKRVEFQPPLDSQTEQQIESMLASANWDAAVCGGGVSCEGTATIKL
ncbi:MAG TPA: hypothetical protein VKT72_10010 [Candidatus Baltobacteraceae bacterium]|nr:hypothetical protein [Candidatus Baltobacteraceae bacterium]